MVTISVELPKQLLERLGLTSDEAGTYLKQLALIDLVRRDEVSSGWAAEKLGMSKDDFRGLLAEHEVPYLDLSEEELRRQVGAAMPDTDRSAS